MRVQFSITAKCVESGTVHTLPLQQEWPAEDVHLTAPLPSPEVRKRQQAELWDRFITLLSAELKDRLWEAIRSIAAEQGQSGG